MTIQGVWLGWIGVGLLIGGAALLAWWLFASPLADRSAPAARPGWCAPCWHKVLSATVLASGALLMVGGRWDELWHRTYGVPLGEDLLWAPHLLIYASFAQTAFVAAFGLRLALGASGGLRARARAEPLLTLLGVLAVYQLASVPVDVLWHRIIGPDLTAASVPHVVMLLGTTAVLLVGAAIALSLRPAHAWAPLDPRPDWDWVALGLVALTTLGWLQLFTTEWEWTDRAPAGQPAALYPLIVLLVGAVAAHLALHATRRTGAATATALVVLLVHAATVTVDRALLPPGPVLAGHLLLLPAAAALDLWYAARLHEAGSRLVLLGGGLLYAALFVGVALPFLGPVVPWVRLGTADWLAVAAVALPAGAVAAMGAASLGRALVGSRGGAACARPGAAVGHPADAA